MRGWLAWSGLIVIAGLPCAAHLSGPHPVWSVAILTAEASIHALALAAGLVVIWAFLRADLSPARKLAAAIFGGIFLAFVAADALLFGLFGLHIGPRTFANILQPQAMTTLGIRAGDVFWLLASSALLATLGSVVIRRVPRRLTALVFFGGFCALDAASSVAGAIARYQGIKPLIGLRSALPLQWRPELNRQLRAVLQTPPRATDDDFQFPSPSLLRPEFRAMATSPLPTHSRIRPDILLIVVESLRADAVPAMPNLQALARQSLVGSMHFSSGNCSFLGNFGLLSGLDPTFWTAAETWRAPQGLAAFVSLGYDVELKSAAALNFGVAQRVLPPGSGTVVPTPLVDPLTRDRLATAWAKSWLDATRARPSLAVLFLDATHWPYLVPGEAEPGVILGDSWSASDQAAPMHARYLRSVRVADQHIGEVLDEARKAGKLEELVVVVVGDHGEAFREHGVFGHGSRLDDEQLRTPLVMKLPGVAPGFLEGPTTHSDVLPTLLAFIGAMPLSGGPGMGTDVLGPGPRSREAPPIVGSCAISAPDGYAAIVGNDKLLLQLDADGTHYVGYLEGGDIPSQRDPHAPKIAAILAAEARAHGFLLKPRPARSTSPTASARIQ